MQIIGFSSFVSWFFKREIALEEIFNPRYFPRSRDFIFFHLYMYFIPVGLLMTWGYQILVKIKQWIFNEKPEPIIKKIENPYKPSPQPLKNLHFKDNLEAFKFAYKNYIADLTVAKMNLGIVQEVINLDSGTQFLVQLANGSNTLFVIGFNDKYVNNISKGNLVYWRCVEQLNKENPTLPQAIGHILATLHPEYDPKTNKWTVKKDLTK